MLYRLGISALIAGAIYIVVQSLLENVMDESVMKAFKKPFSTLTYLILLVYVMVNL